MNNDIVNREFREFGDKMYIMLILFLLNFIIPFLPGIIMVIYTFRAIGDIKRANKELKNDDLDDFRIYILSSYILLVVVGALIVIAMINIGLTFWPFIESKTIPTRADIMNMLGVLMLPIFIFLIALILLLVVGILRYKAWGNLNEFFTRNSKIFPEAIAYDMRRGSEYLKTASLCYILGFLIITIPIGLLYEILGYIKLSKLKDLPYSSAPRSTQPTEVPKPIITGGPANFCQFCGSKITEDASFCPSCGQKF